MDLINPWGALRRARRLIAELLVDIGDLEQNEENDYLAYVSIAQRLDHVEAKIAQGHFRNPKTGRIGRKGEMFND